MKLTVKRPVVLLAARLVCPHLSRAVTVKTTGGQRGADTVHVCRSPRDGVSDTAGLGAFKIPLNNTVTPNKLLGRSD